MLSVEFLEKYNRLDKLLKDVWNSQSGVTEYINQMDGTPLHYRHYATSWQADYKMLKHVRWVRNKLAHEAGAMQSDLCTEEHLLYVTRFFSRIVEGSDPLSQVRVAVRQKQKEQELARQAQKQQQTQIVKIEKPTQKSAWAKFVEKLKKVFGKNKKGD